jgi:hypothetical protein
MGQKEIKYLKQSEWEHHERTMGKNVLKFIDMCSLPPKHLVTKAELLSVLPPTHNGPPTEKIK